MRVDMRQFRVYLLMTALVLTHSGFVEAQALGYGIAGPTGNSAGFGGLALHAAAGGEVLLNGGPGVGAEVGMLGNSSSVLSVVSVNGYHHFPTADRKISPFVTGGYSRFTSGDGSFNSWNVGGGADFWRNNRFGFRADFRDHVRSRLRGSVHYFAVRAGIVFR